VTLPQPAKPKLPSKSTKPQAVKTAVIAKSLDGQPKRRIAKDLGITTNTVRSILKESQIDSLLEAGTIQCARLIPKSVEVINRRLDKDSETAAFRLLEGIGVLGPNATKQGSSPMHASVQLNQKIAVLYAGDAGKDKANAVQVIDVKSTDESMDSTGTEVHPSSQKGPG